jgi:hypothetical protein
MQLFSFNRNPTKAGDCNNISSNNFTVKYTPLEQQVLELKKQHSGMILMIQTAYKYTFFGEDAEVCFDLTLIIVITEFVLVMLVLMKLFQALTKIIRVVR